MKLKKAVDRSNPNPATIQNPERISARQIRAIWALASRLEFSEPELHSWIESMTGRKSIRLLKKQEAQKVIHGLFLTVSERKKQADAEWNVPIGGTKKQIDFLRVLCREIGFNLHRLENLARKMYGIKELKLLTVKQASGLIEALKAIRVRSAE